MIHDIRRRLVIAEFKIDRQDHQRAGSDSKTTLGFGGTDDLEWHGDDDGKISPDLIWTSTFNLQPSTIDGM